MGLRFICGKAGTGKSTFCFNEIKEKIKNKEKIYIITPEQFSYSAEKKLLETLNEDASINAEVITFNRMAKRVFNEVGGANNILISKSSKAMLMYSILEKEKKNLKFLSSSKDNIDLALKEITEFKKNNITIHKLENGIEQIENEQLKEKLNDIKIVFNAYENYMQNKFIDEEDVLTKLYNKLPQSKMFNDTIVYIDEFIGFTKQEYNIFTEILRKAKQVNITICTDSLEENTEKEGDIFYFNKNFKKLLTKCGQIVDEKQEKPVLLKTKYRFKNPEINHLEENIYNRVPLKYKGKNENIKIFLANNPYTELEYVAQEITRLSREEGYKYSDIAIITKDVEASNNIAKAIFSKYSIPVFIDEKYEITDNIILKYILSVLEIFSSNWDTETVFNYIKSGFLNLDKNEIYKIENYCKKMGINRRKWYKTKWNKYEDLREKIVTPLLEFEKEINKEKTAQNISKRIYDFIIKNDIQNTINKKVNKLEESGENRIAKEYQSSLNILIDVLDEIVAVFKDEKVTMDKYKEIIKIGLRNKELGEIPQSLDQVILGSIDRTRSHKVKAIFIIGINDGVFPSINRNEGFLNDKDRETLKEKKLEIAKGTLDNLYEEQFNIYKALTTPEEKLYLSYTSTGKDGTALRPSVIISKIKKIFPNIEEESDIIKQKANITNQKATFEELLKNIRKIENGEEIDDIWIDVYNWYNKNEYWSDKLRNSLKALKYTNIAETIKKENIERLYGSTLKASISRLEQYIQCPFSFHLKYGLKLKEEEEYKIKPLDTGSFMHKIIDTFFERISDINIDEEKTEKIIDEIINEELKLESNYIFSSSPKFIVLTNRLKKAVKESIKYIMYQIKSSDFEVAGNEVEFNEKIGNMEIYGKIDRMDIGKNEDGEYIRIIDYKSSDYDVNLNQVIAGRQIQLMTYIDAISRQENKEPAGIFYFKLMEPIIKDSKNLSDEEIENRIRKSFKMNGLILADIKVVKMMDKKLETGYSDIIPVYVDTKGNLNMSKSRVITKEDFSNLQKTVRKIIKQISNEILNGKIEIKPMYDKSGKKASCEQCSYKSICAFNPKINSYEYSQKKTKEEILDEIRQIK